MSDLRTQFGQIDIYLFDQLLRGRIRPGMRVLEVGCGSGRNLTYLLQAGCDVAAVDSDPEGVARVRRMANACAPTLPGDNFRVESIEAISFPNNFADVVLSIAVLHFARDDAQFNAMLASLWRVLRPRGFCSAVLPPASAWRSEWFRAAAGVFCCRMARSATWWTRRFCWI